MQPTITQEQRQAAKRQLIEQIEQRVKGNRLVKFCSISGAVASLAPPDLLPAKICEYVVMPQSAFEIRL